MHISPDPAIDLCFDGVPTRQTMDTRKMDMYFNKEETRLFCSVWLLII